MYVSLVSPAVRLIYLDTRSSNISGATTASTKTFLTALALNGIIAGVAIVAFTVVWRYFRLIYEPRSLSVFESCACVFVLQFLALTSLQKETAGTVVSLLGMAYIRLQGGLPQDQEHKRTGLLLFCPFPPHDGPRHAANLAHILGCSPPSYLRQYGRSRPFRS